MFEADRPNVPDHPPAKDEINITRLLDPSLRGALPKDFLHGYASASYQIEGGYDQGGRGLSKWDVLLKDTENGEEACDSYHLWEEDVKLLVQYGVTAYRFSIAWPRIVPKGGKDDPVNQEGIDYYNKLIDALLAHGITPLVTLFHWDMPLALEDKYGGFTACKPDQPALLADFVNYARVCFEAFGDRVKNWITINEIYSMLTAMVLHRDTYDPEVTRWIQARNLILGHAQIVDLYRREFQPEQKGRIGITLNIEYCEPYDDTPETARAASRALDIHAGLFADPIYKGRINPTIMEKAGERFEDFAAEEWAIIRGSSDFFGLNHYSTRWYTAQPIQDDPMGIKASFGDNEPRTEREDGTPIGFRGHNGHPYTVPWGFYKLLHHVSDMWTAAGQNVTGGTIPIIITENGFSGPGEGDLSAQERVNDVRRQEYFDAYIERLVQARREGVVVDGYMGWSLLDNLEWSMGYGPRFGVTMVDRENGFKRTPKNSALYLAKAFRHLKGE